MPGPVSDSYHPEFGTGAVAREVEDAIEDVCLVFTQSLGEELKDIVGVVRGNAGLEHTLNLSERDLRIIRFCLNTARECI